MHDPHLDAYCNKLVDAFMKAILDASFDPASGVMHVHTGEVLKAALKVSALISESDPQFTTPAGRKAGASEIARRFLGYVRAAQAEGGLAYAMRQHCPVVVVNEVAGVQ